MMTLAIENPSIAKPGPQNAALRDYDSVRRAIAFISEHWRDQPAIEAMADAAGVTPDELHHLFRRWAGLTPKAFMQALPASRVRGGCTTCSSPMKRCRPANGKTAAPA
jgi:AraC family transcriptional regulator, regulatory protein of adaptative response / methylated-DNA-[protein]-cysteine methyltransferase